VGPIAGQRINAQIKLAILTVIETSQDSGVSARRSCSLLMIAYRRVVRWQGCLRAGLGLVDGTPGPKEALHRLLPEEVANITRDQFRAGNDGVLALDRGDEGGLGFGIGQWDAQLLDKIRLRTTLYSSGSVRFDLSQELRRADDMEHVTGHGQFRVHLINKIIERSQKPTVIVYAGRALVEIDLGNEQIAKVGNLKV
jgi:hypothetical protein